MIKLSELLCKIRNSNSSLIDLSPHLNILTNIKIKDFKAYLNTNKLYGNLKVINGKIHYETITN